MSYPIFGDLPRPVDWDASKGRPGRVPRLFDGSRRWRRIDTVEPLRWPTTIEFKLCGTAGSTTLVVSTGCAVAARAGAGACAGSGVAILAKFVWYLALQSHLKNRTLLPPHTVTITYGALSEYITATPGCAYITRHHLS
jgi:hypothetical protein